MSTWVEGVEMRTTTCASCGVMFALTAELMTKLRNTHRDFHCPNGHVLVFRGDSEADRLKRELRRREEMLEAANARASTAERDLRATTKAHKKMRARVMNGVCPCCDRTFQNLMRHMRTQHPEFTELQTLGALRKAFAMTQEAVGQEVGLPAPYVSNFERGRYVPEQARLRLQAWVDRHTTTDA